MYFIQSGNEMNLTSNLKTKVHGALPIGFYDVQFVMGKGHFLVVRDDVRALPKRLYGSVRSRAERIMQTYGERAAKGLQTGVLLSGEKGSGKTLLARYLMDVCQMPVIMVNHPFAGEEFAEIIVSGGRKMIFFDEFEKVYKQEEQQHALLAMLDGTYAASNLVVATLNDTTRLSSPLKNRPSRFYYHYRYGSVDREFVDEFCKEQLASYSTDTVRDIITVVNRMYGFNFDMLQTLVEELNRYGESVEATLNHVNIVPDRNMIPYEIKLKRADTGVEIPIKEKTVQVGHWSPSNMNFMVTSAERTIPEDNDDPDYKGYFEEHYFEGVSHFQNEDENKNLVFRNGHGVIATLATGFKPPREWTV